MGGARTMDDVARFTRTAEPPYDALARVPLLRDLVRKMLHKDPKYRISMTGASQHPWFKTMSDYVIGSDVLQSVVDMHAKSEAQARMSEQMLTRLKVHGMRALHEALRELDSERSGYATADVLRAGAGRVAADVGLTD